MLRYYPLGLYVSLIQREQRNPHQTQIIEKVRTDPAKSPGVKAFAAPSPVGGGERGEPLQFALKGPNLEKVAALSTQLTNRLQQIPVIGPLDTDLQLDMPELRLIPDREKTRDAGLAPAAIGRYNLQYAAAFFATPTIPEGDASVIVLDEAKKLLPTGYQVELIGCAKEFSKTVGYVLFAFATGLILVYMTLASQFNSFIQPLIVMVAQPLAIIGGIFGLWLGGHSLNIYSMIGLVLLVGLVEKNSILLIDLTNQLRAQES